MIKKTILFWFLVLCFNSKAQNWVPLDTGIHQGSIVLFPYGLLADTANNNLFAFGAEYPSSYFPTNRGGFTVWNNTIHRWQQWYPHILSGSYGHEVVQFNNKVLYFYPFWENNDNTKPRTRVLRFSTPTDMDTLKILPGQDWYPMRNCLYNGKLLLSCGGTANPVDAIATFDGDTIIPIGDTALSNIYAVSMYNGELYGAGMMSSGRHGVAKLTTNGWKRIFQVEGGTASLGGLRVYNNRLYIFGAWCEDQSPKNFGNCIVAYDGTNWDRLGGGITNAIGGCIYTQVWDAAVCHNKLYLSGKFSHAAQLADNKLVSWNDTSWCSLRKDLDSVGTLFRLETLNDTLYAAADFQNMYGDTSYGMVAKMYNMGYADTCTSSFVGIRDLSNSKKIFIYPNPTNSILNISDENNELENSTIEITNSLGQNVFQASYSNSIDVSTLPMGCYFIIITKKSGEYLRSKFIKN